jgi:uncharacterized protein (TIGR03437 family)
VFYAAPPRRPIALDPSASQIHIIGSCDSTESSVVTPCVPEVHHADGTYVTSQQPAVPGETLEILAYGLGRGDAPMPTGFGAPSPPVAVGDVYVGLKFGQNLAPSAPPVDSVAEVQMTPAAVGLYRIRFVVPPVPDDAPACSAVGSNLTVSVSRASSLVGAGICVYQVDAQTNPVAPPIRPR